MSYPKAMLYTFLLLAGICALVAIICALVICGQKHPHIGIAGFIAFIYFLVTTMIWWTEKS